MAESEILNRVVRPASPTQRAWLAGFFAGMDAATTAPQPAVGAQWLTGLRQIAEVHDGNFRLTANQNLLIANVPKEKRKAIEALVAEHGLTTGASSR